MLSFAAAATITGVPLEIVLMFNLLTLLSRECLLDQDTVLECSKCSQDVSSDGRQRVLCTVRNEGGTQQDFDILPPAREEAYFRSNPEERRGHAFLEFCKDGDTDAIVHLVKDEDGEGHHDILRYQDAFGGSMETGLHVSIRHGQDTAVWLLLYLASNLDDASFPPHVKKALQNAGLTIKDRRPQPDIRSLTDSSDRTALDLATGQQVSRWEEVFRNNALIVRE